MVKTGGGDCGETSHAFSPPMQIIHCTNEKRKAHRKDVVMVVVTVSLNTPYIKNTFGNISVTRQAVNNMELTFTKFVTNHCEPPVLSRLSRE
jgi:hypothetical protein